MACAGCERRKAWLKKWVKIAYERATGKPPAADSRTARADLSDKPAGGDESVPLRSAGENNQR